MATPVVTTSTVLNSGVASTPTAASASTIDLEEVFEVSIGKNSGLIQIDNVSGVNGSVTFSIAGGTQFGGSSALTGTILQGTSQVIEVDTAKFENSSGVMSITVTPALGKILLTDHALTIQAIQLV